jgi:hypothetical protein
MWLGASVDVPVLGAFVDEAWVAYLFSYAGLLFDLTIVPLLLWRRTRPSAYVAVLVFHVLTNVLFPIGMFPWVMIALTTIFFAPDWPRRVAERLGFSRERAREAAPATPPSAAPGDAGFRVTDAATGATAEVDPRDYLTPLQARMMASQPDMILDFAHFVAERFATPDGRLPAVRADVYASLNGRPNRRLVDPTIDLARKPASAARTWVLPLE